MPASKMPPLIIRAAAASDVASIHAIERQSATASHWTSAQYEKLLKNGVVLVAEHTEDLRGFICVNPIAGEWEIENLVVAPEFQRRGIAEALVRELIHRVRSQAAKAILLEVRESNEPARRLYEKLAFRQLGRRRGYYANPPEDAVLYALQFVS
jgi:ribosomal-protein-alanine acetyltransferase